MAAHLVWMDLEMTGLDPDKERIIEIATIVTDGELEVVAEGPVLAVRQPESLLEAMDDWNQSHHSSSGLLERLRADGVTEREAEAATLAFLEQHVEKKRSPLCGNTIWQDRRFLTRYMPTLEDYLHYRMVDVSSIKELVQRWRPDLMAGFSKKNEHTALADVRESIAELRYYREHFLRHQRPDHQP
ncbi:MAG: oligoribonuclease [Gammaproteobacteria bacterium]|nr:oligoribonuclease [Gammaproteobacteria bacterium]